MFYFGDNSQLWCIKKIRKTVSTLQILKILLYYDQTNNELHYTEAISKHRFRITQSDIVQSKEEIYIHLILPCLQSFS